MKTSLRSQWLCQGILTVVLAYAATAPAQQPDEIKKRLRSAERELDHLRDTLHDAQRELAAKNDRIDELEKQLVSAASPQKNPQANEGRSSTATGKKEGQKPRKMEVKGAAKQESTKRTTTTPFDVTYDRNSAVNYEGREAALSWVREQLRKNPDVTLKIGGLANDSEYPEVNQMVAENRARYLADFLVLSGVPAESIVSIGGKPAKETGDKGRAARIEIVGRPGEPGRGEQKKPR